MIAPTPTTDFAVGDGARTRFVRADRGQAVGMARRRRADEAGGPGSASRGLVRAFVQPLAAKARTRSAPPLRVATGPPTPLGRAGQQVADRRETARSAHQGHPRHTVGQRDLGSAHHAATQPPVNPATTRKTAKRVLTPFPSSTPDQASNARLGVALSTGRLPAGITRSG